MSKMALRKRRLIELGAGRVPVESFRRAQRRKKNDYLLIDKEPTDFAALRKLGQRTGVGRNVATIEGDAIVELSKMEPESKDIIYGGYITNNMALPENEALGRAKSLMRFSLIKAACVALKTNGRMLFIQNRNEVEPLRRAATGAGLTFYSRELTEKEAKTSWSLEARIRATHKKRQTRVREVARMQGKDPREFEGREDELKPTLIIMTKRKKPSIMSRIRQVTKNTTN